MTATLTKARTAVREHGVAGTARKALDRGIDRGWVLRETHIWFELDLTRPQPPRALPDGLALGEARLEHSPLIEAIEGVTPAEAPERFEHGGTPWAIVDGDRAAFACWTFAAAAPVLAHPSGWLPLDGGMHVLEDSVTSPHYRGQGIAPGAWSALVAELAARGGTTLITKVGVDNVASCRAVAKAGFQHAATMTLVKAGPRKHVTMSAGTSPAGRYLAEQLAS